MSSAEVFTQRLALSLSLPQAIIRGFCKQHDLRRPRWLSWMRRPTGDQEVGGSTPA